MADLRIVDAPEIPTENITGEEKIPTGGSGNYSISLNSLADYTKTKKDLADNTSVDGKVNGVRQELETHIEDLLNPHQVTKGQIGLGNVDNTADADKPVSNSTQSAIISAVAPKADKTYVDNQLTLKANKADVYTKSETYTKQESSDLVNNRISTALTPVNASLELAKRGIANRYDSSLTYNLSERVVLTNGDIVKSIINGNTNDPNVSMVGWVKDGSIVKSVYDYGAKNGQDSTQAIKDAIASEDVLYFGGVGDEFIVSEQIDLRDNCYYISNGAKFIAALGIEGAQPYTPKSIINASGKTGITIDGVIETYIDHNLFSSLGDSALKPTIVGFLADSSTDCKFGFFKSIGSVNYFYTSNFKEYGIVDVRNSTDCEIKFDVDGLYGVESAPSSTPSTNGAMLYKNTRLKAKGVAKNTYWSGIFFDGIDCRLFDPVTKNTKGSSLNISGYASIAYNVDLEGTKQGNISFGHGMSAIACGVVGGYVRGAQNSNVSFLEERTQGFTSQKCFALGLVLTGWGQTGNNGQDWTTNAVRLEGFDHKVDVTTYKDLDGYVSFGDAITVRGVDLANPLSSGHSIKLRSNNAGVSASAPNCMYDLEVVGDSSKTLVALKLNFRCANSLVKNIAAVSCSRAIVQSPNTADPNDYVNTRIINVHEINCANKSVYQYATVGRLSDICQDYIYSSKTNVLLGDILYGMNVYSSDSGISGSGKLASSIRHVCTDAFGTSYGVDILSSTISAGSLANYTHKFRYNSFEIPFAGGQLIQTSPDGTRYKLVAPNGGGAATWVAVT